MVKKLGSELNQAVKKMGQRKKEMRDTGHLVCKTAGHPPTTSFRLTEHVKAGLRAASAGRNRTRELHPQLSSFPLPLTPVHKNSQGTQFF